LTIYFDTGILLKLYSAEADSAKAIALVQRFGSPICFTDLQDAELRNALYRKNARNEISRPEFKEGITRSAERYRPGNSSASVD